MHAPLASRALGATLAVVLGHVLVLGQAALSAQSGHWAYVKPERPPEPAVRSADWPRNPIDGFVLAGLEEQGLGPAPRAEPARLLRRLHLDLTGLPPSVEAVTAFESDDSEAAWDAAVDRLLASPRFGEHWARHWLDLARYADSNGFQADQLRDSWAWRDWVIDALNAGMPFDQFTVEQLAGDLLPGATVEQQIATGFHRTVTCNVEAGVQPEANRVNQVVDRVNTTATVWLGTTMECAQCHDHKYDPFTQRDYYRLFAYFNNTPVEVVNPLGDQGVSFDFAGPWLELPLRAEQQAARSRLAAQRDELRQRHAQALQAAESSQSARERELVEQPGDHHLASRPEVAGLARQLADLDRQIQAIEPDRTLVMVEQDTPRDTCVMRRGDYLQPGERVAAGTPQALHPFPSEWPQDRLGLARWLVSSENPLVARVTVNRWWSQIFGRGLVSTEEDFGRRCTPPSHPELLDWLAVEFVESGWSMKHMLRLIVTSATYQQSSRRPVGRDDDNRLLGRGPRLRMSAEMIRDNALAVAGLLSLEMGGPPVFPPQPAGLWRQTGRNEPKYVIASDADRFRRGIYVIWRRAAPYPSFVLFDGPDRSACHPKRSRTNTPMQALVLMNDTAYVEAALGLARRVMQEEDGVAASVERMFRVTLARRPSVRETEHLAAVFEQAQARLAADPAVAEALLRGLPAIEVPAELDRIEIAAWFHVATILLNLDETITKG